MTQIEFNFEPLDDEECVVEEGIDVAEEPPKEENKKAGAPKEDTRPEILKKVDKVITKSGGPLLERIRAIKEDKDAMTASGMSRGEIEAKYRLTMTGSENSAQLRKVQAEAINLRTEAGAYLRDAERRKKRIDELYNACRSKVDAEIVAANVSAGRNDKISDKAREIISRQVYEVGDPDELANAYCEEMEWKGIVKDLDAFLEALKNNAMLLMSENKVAR